MNHFPPFLICLILAFVLDAIIGDPETKYHPIRSIGWLIKKIESVFYAAKISKRASGILLVFASIAIVLAVVLDISFLLSKIMPLLGVFWTIFILYTCLAFRSLIDAGERIMRDLKKNDLVAAREHLSWIVSRDTARLDEHDIVRGTIESLSENLNDAVIAPLFYAFLFGIPGIVIYKTANTLDSMVGYKSERYLKFGWCAARLDDILNYIPARVAFLFILAGTAILRYDARSAWKTVFKYSQTGESPNGGIGICAFAGALRVTLGGTNYFNGKSTTTPNVPPVDTTPVTLSPHDIKRSEYLIIASTLIGFSIFATIFIIIA